MFSYFRGEVAEIMPDKAVLDVGGVGYELCCSSKTLGMLSVGKQAKLLAYMHISQDLVVLYGFATSKERTMFLRLISVSRVGPKAAMNILSVLRPAELASAIVAGEDVAIARVPGLGKKTAQRIILELKEKIATEEAFAGVVPGENDLTDAQTDMVREAIGALIALGYDASMANRAVKAAAPCERVEELITKALKSLAK